MFCCEKFSTKELGFAGLALYFLLGDTDNFCFFMAEKVGCKKLLIFFWADYIVVRALGDVYSRLSATEASFSTDSFLFKCMALRVLLITMGDCWSGESSSALIIDLA
jgi:hypothetical protein